MGGREYLGCLLTLAVLCVIAGAPVAVVAGIVLWKIFGGILILAGIAIVVVLLVGGTAAAAELIERIRGTKQ